MKKIVKIASLLLAAAALIVTTACSESLPPNVLPPVAVPPVTTPPEDQTPEVSVDKAALRAAVLQQVNIIRTEKGFDPIVLDEGWTEYMEMFISLFERKHSATIVWNGADWVQGAEKGAALLNNSDENYKWEFGYEMVNEDTTLNLEFPTSQAELRALILNPDLRLSEGLIDSDIRKVGIGITQINGKLYWVGVGVGYSRYYDNTTEIH